MDLDDLQALLWLHQHGSLQGAARAQAVARTTLRRRLDRLESTVGRPLTHGERADLHLTPAGRLLVERGADLLRARDSLVGDARSARASASSLRFLCALGIATPLAAQLVRGVGELLPDVEISVDFSSDPLRHLDEGYDVVVHWGEAPIDRDGYTRVVFRAPLRVLASPDYLERHGTPESFEDLAQHRVLHWSVLPPVWPLVEGGAIHIQPYYESNDLYMVGCMTGAGMGLALIPDNRTAVDPAVAGLVPVFGNQVAASHDLRIHVTSPTESGSPVALLIERIEGVAELLAPLG